MKYIFLRIYNKLNAALHDVLNALNKHQGEGFLRFGEVLLKERIISVSQLEKALELQQEQQRFIGLIIVAQGYATEIAVVEAINRHYGISVETLSDNIENLIRGRHHTLKEKLLNLRVPIRVKLSIAIIFIIGLTTVILGFVVLTRQKEQLYLQTIQTGRVSLSYFTNNARVPLLNDDILRLNTLIKEASSVEGLLYAVIVDREKEIKAHTDHTKIGTTMRIFDNIGKVTKEGDISYFNYTLPSGAQALNMYRPVVFKDKELGEVHVGISLDFINKQIRKESAFILFLGLLIVVLGIIIALLLGFSFSRPISRLVLATHEIGKGNYKYRIEPIRKDEFGDLARAFNYMSQELWKKLVMQQSFGSYVSHDVLDMIMAHPEESWLKGTRSEATVMFTDVRDFTSYAETIEPEVVVEDLNKYFEIITRIILEYGGYVDKFIGDAVMGVFCLPIHRKDHALRAVKAAVAMQKELQQDGNRNPLLSRVGISINSGLVVSGNLGSEVKMEYTVIGDDVNVASRLNKLAGSGEIIISKSTHDMVNDLFHVKELPRQMLKGKSGPVEVFQVLGIK